MWIHVSASQEKTKKILNDIINNYNVSILIKQRGDTDYHNIEKHDINTIGDGINDVLLRVS